MNIVSDKIENEVLIETYRAKARKSGLNYFRAAGHGLADVATLGLWEVAGTPVEVALSNNLGYVTVIATYKGSKDTSAFESIKIYDANGRSVEEKK